MASASPSFFRRALIAFSSFRRIVKDPAFARAVARLATSDTPHPLATPAAPAAVPLASAAPDSALLLLGLLQREGRLMDFLQEDIQSYRDQEIGAAARVVHRGCREVINTHLSLVPVREEPEGSRVTLAPGFDSAANRPTGNVVGDPPFHGTLVHRGWRVEKMTLPQTSSGHDLRIIAAAEIEL
ncbi:hypothetical protein CKO25_03775 [Thiocapsa imhoffii]|uniref:DUF2760 domain-containing protein n=1 Tax=Thiocapsa imhoffii TaxID=382777 RepID=A0A9X1B8B6_9GAMM|nr:DUF2760 domain-containing protein [Thiocapsa imhoffii]MBK1643791.1 hypothetical protein [Thiocapsa imhoffii]